MADLRQEGILQSMKLRNVGRMQQEEAEKRPNPFPADALHGTAGRSVACLGPAVHRLDHAVPGSRIRGSLAPLRVARIARESLAPSCIPRARGADAENREGKPGTWLVEATSM